MEIQLLLASSRNDNNPDRAQEIRSLCSKRIDWTRVIQKALEHGVLPLVYRSLCVICPEEVPEPVLTKLRNHYQVNARQSFLFSRELIRILTIFNNNGINAIPFKGPVLAEIVYGDLALRQTSDLDIMIMKKDVPIAIDLLKLHGYRLDKKHQFNWEAHFIRSDRSCVVDLHWGVSPLYIHKDRDMSFKIDLEQLWNRSETVRFMGMPIHQFSPEDLLMVRCQNSVKEFWKDKWPQLKWIIDIGRIIDCYPQMDWKYLISTARELGNLRLLYFCLSLSLHLIRAPIPFDLLKIIQKDKPVQSLTREAIDKIYGNKDMENKFLNPKTGRVARDLFCIKLKERLLDKVPYAKRLLKGYINTPSYPIFHAIKLIRNCTQANKKP